MTSRRLTEAAHPNPTFDDPLDSSGQGAYAPGEIPEGLSLRSNRSPNGENGPDPVGAEALRVTNVFME